MDSNSSQAPPGRFTAQASGAEDLLKSQTVGLVHLDDFRKRRADAIEQQERDAYNIARKEVGSDSDAARIKKRKKASAKGKLSFGDDEEEDGASDNRTQKPSKNGTAHAPDTELDSAKNQRGVSVARESTADNSSGSGEQPKKRLGPNSSIAVAPKSMTKSALLKEAQARETLRKEYLAMQEAVKATEIAIPFVFYDGTNIPGGVCKVKKGDQVWLFLDRGRKIGVERGIGDQGSRRRGWARVGVDDLMLVRGEIIIPHHYEFYYFIVNKTKARNGQALFEYKSTMDPDAVKATLAQNAAGSTDGAKYNPLSMAGSSSANKSAIIEPGSVDIGLEGYHDDPSFTRVVDRRWYERNKHIYPASTWEEYDPEKEIAGTVRKDAEGNSFFFSS